MQSTESIEDIESVTCSCATARFMPVKEAVILLPVSKAYLYAGLRAGRFPGTSFGRVRALLRTFVEEFIARVEAGELIDFEIYAADWRARNSAEASA
ncbi:hypothetical protein ACFOY2_05600 [Nonomuraea purpurea]|uniref:Uncharacterized protein n=1 Tax=Nonomuraea purpurea TaxID=1849276 RepID=A0ABV8G0E3_9ACTN